MADVTNYTIENASGANVRIDLNNVFAAIQSSNSKSSDLAASQCVAGMPFLNTTTNILKIRNSSNGGFTEIGNIDTANLGLLLKSGGTMTGALLGHDGSNAAAPAFSFDTDTDLGLFRNSANIMGFASSGTEQMIFDANGITLRTQNEIRFGDSDSSHYVGIKAPATVSSNVNFVLPTADGSSGQFIKTDGSGNLSFASVVNTITIGSNSISPGSTATDIAGLTSLTSTTLTGTNVKATNLQDSSGGNGSTPVQLQQGRAKAWVNFNGQSSGSTKTINNDFNVSSVTDIAQGDFRVNFDTAMPNVNYCVAMSHKEDNSTSGGSGARPLIRRTSDAIQTGSVRTTLANVSSGAGVDPLVFNVIVVGD
tara:strand:+ start:25 stop:1122 length:1098 start_codon:yes stop_codon:yes gene_type:complete